ncbi:MAG: RNA 2',3'-cyclic phosphodiesterase, partial [Chloroflexi bacterium]|nr:RNA 2',3'-cyclic phosphodiesterase [Chloroflexota bacterium]
MTEPTEKTHRLFVACELPEDVRHTVGGLVESLREQSGGTVRWVNPSNLHVTLKFLSEVPERQIPAVKMALQEAVVRHSAFFLELANIGTFGGREGLRVMWAAVAGDVLRLEALARDVNRALSVVGFERETRPFRPHLTLGRVRNEVGTRQRAELEVEVGKIEIPECEWR